jgi:protein involved in polysaccharide export with SLBB domain
MGAMTTVDRCRRVFFGLLSLGVLLSGCSTDVAKLPPPPAAPPAIAYRVQPGDTLDVSFLHNPELNDQPTVQPDGRISMLYATNIQVGGLTTEQVRSVLDKAYSQELVKPMVSVALKGPIAWQVYVVGEVTKPSQVSDTGPLPTVADAISKAGGFKESGDRHKVVLLRRVGDDKQAYMIDMISSGTRGLQPQNNVQLAANDVIFVPKTGVADVYTGYQQYFTQFMPDFLGYQFRVKP